jgi:hypothetical protein
MIIVNCQTRSADSSVVECEWIVYLLRGASAAGQSAGNATRELFLHLSPAGRCNAVEQHMDSESDDRADRTVRQQPLSQPDCRSQPGIQSVHARVSHLFDQPITGGFLSDDLHAQLFAVWPRHQFAGRLKVADAECDAHEEHGKTQPCRWHGVSSPAAELH